MFVVIVSVVCVIGRTICCIIFVGQNFHNSAKIEVLTICFFY